MFDGITTVPALNAARRTLDAALIASLNAGTITDALDLAMPDEHDYRGGCRTTSMRDTC